MQLFVASSSNDQRLSVPVCTDGIVLKMPDPSECPDNVQDLRPCDQVSEGEYCKSRGECGTDVRANNCPTTDRDGVRVWLPVYLKDIYIYIYTFTYTYIYIYTYIYNMYILVYIYIYIYIIICMYI